MRTERRIHIGAGAPARRHRRRRSPLLVALTSAVLLAMVGLAACGAPNDPGSAASTPSSGDLTISDLPLPAAARSAGGTATEGSTTSASYLVDGSSPAQILTFYDDRLPSLGWELEKPDAATGDGDADATWLQANSKLLISVEAHAGTGGDAGVITQLDLEITDQ